MRRALFALAVLSSGCSTITLELVTLKHGEKIVGVKRPKEPPKIVVIQDPTLEPPAAKISDDKISIEGKIQFKPKSAQIEKSSHAALDAVARVLRENAALKRIEIQGHTARAKGSMKLSQQRANAVKEYLVSRGVDERRLVAKGYGDRRPIAENSSAIGKEKNRRVELVIVAKDQVALATEAKK